MGRADGKIAIVTGAGQGIGKAIAEKLAADGATVVVTDLDAATAGQTAAALPGAVALRTDVTDRDGVQAMVDDVVRQFGRVDAAASALPAKRSIPPPRAASSRSPSHWPGRWPVTRSG